MLILVKKITMNKLEIIDQLKTVVKPYIKNQEAFDNLSETTDFINDLKINSANLVDVILDIEEVFDIVIDNASMEKMLDVKSTLAIIETKLAEK
jgi:acyl carrier protein